MNLTSASIDHHKLNPGLHFWEKTKVEGLNLYDLRFKKPVRYPNYSENEVLNPDSIHTIEHLLAYHLRVKADEQILSVFPYGCQTGFGCLAFMEPQEFKELLVETLEKCLTLNSIPFSTTILCGNMYLNSMDKAKADIREFLDIVKTQTLQSITEVERVR